MQRDPSGVWLHPSQPLSSPVQWRDLTAPHPSPGPTVARPLPAAVPHPHPSRGAGGPPRRAAGRVSCEPLALVLGADPLRVHVALEAMRHAGFQRLQAPATPGDWPKDVDLVLADLAEPATCRRLQRLRDRERPPVIAAYVQGRPLSLAVHAGHACVDLLLDLVVLHGRPALLPVDVAPGTLGLTVRECDVLALVLAGLTDREIAAELVISAATVRSHVRSSLRRLGATDRSELRRRDRPL